PLRALLVSLKYHGEQRVAECCGERLASAVAAEPWRDPIDLLVPVPMHPWRRIQRPCNHAAVLADVVGRRLGIPVRHAAVHRSRYAPSQTEARSPAERFAHVKDSFAARRWHGVAGRTVCVIDNVTV